MLVWITSTEETLAFAKSVYDKLLDGEDAPLMAYLQFISVQMNVGKSESYRRYV